MGSSIIADPLSQPPMPLVASQPPPAPTNTVELEEGGGPLHEKQLGTSGGGPALTAVTG